MNSRRVKGPNLTLRLVDADDAEYIHRLRTNPAYNEHLSEITGTTNDQRRWIEAYKAREALGVELYYLIERHDGRPCGTVRLYDIVDDQFTWGSWILDENKPAKAALESAILSFGVGFGLLGKSRAVVEVRLGNTHAEAFYRRFGMTETGSDDHHRVFEYLNVQFKRDRHVYDEILDMDSQR